MNDYKAFNRLLLPAMDSKAAGSTTQRLVGVLRRERGARPLGGLLVDFTALLNFSRETLGPSDEGASTHTLLLEDRMSSVGVGEVGMGSPFATPTTGRPPGVKGGTLCSCTEANLRGGSKVTKWFSVCILHP